MVTAVVGELGRVDYQLRRGRRVVITTDDDGLAAHIQDTCLVLDVVVRRGQTARDDIIGTFLTALRIGLALAVGLAVVGIGERTAEDTFCLLILTIHETGVSHTVIGSLGTVVDTLVIGLDSQRCLLDLIAGCRRTAEGVLAAGLTGDDDGIGADIHRLGDGVVAFLVTHVVLRAGYLRVVRLQHDLHRRLLVQAGVGELGLADYQFRRGRRIVGAADDDRYGLDAEGNGLAVEEATAGDGGERRIVTAGVGLGAADGNLCSGIAEGLRAVSQFESTDGRTVGTLVVRPFHLVERDRSRPVAGSGGDDLPRGVDRGAAEVDLRDGLTADDHLGITVGVLPFCRYLQVIIALAVGLVAAEGFKMHWHHDAAGTCLGAADAARTLDGDDLIIGPVARVWRHLKDNPLARGDGCGGGPAGSGRGLGGAIVPFDSSVRHAAANRQGICCLRRASRREQCGDGEKYSVDISVHSHVLLPLFNNDYLTIINIYSLLRGLPFELPALQVIPARRPYKGRGQGWGLYPRCLAICNLQTCRSDDGGSA